MDCGVPSQTSFSDKTVSETLSIAVPIAVLSWWPVARDVRKSLHQRGHTYAKVAGLRRVAQASRLRALVPVRRRPVARVGDSAAQRGARMAVASTLKLPSLPVGERRSPHGAWTMERRHASATYSVPNGRTARMDAQPAATTLVHDAASHPTPRPNAGTQADIDQVARRLQWSRISQGR